MSEQRFDADFAVYKPKLDIARSMLFANKEHGKSYPSQINEIFMLARGKGRLTAQDYFYFQLYDDSRYDKAAKRRFLSERVHHGIIVRCCDIRWWATADDKALAQLILRDCDARLPTTQAVYATHGRNFGSLPTCRTIEDLGAFLSQDARFPVFAKPIGGVASFGALIVKGFDTATGAVEYSNSETVSLESFARQIGHEDGYLFQDLLVPHPDVRAICGDTVSTVRMVLIIEDGTPEIIQTVWKIPAGKNIADNFWRAGNMLAAIDMDTGRVKRVVRGFGPDQEIMDKHPDTGQPLAGLALPHWDQVKELCLDHAMAFHKQRFQSWDIALCADGPVVVEVNTGSAFNLSQLATGEGFLTDRFQAFLDHCGYGAKVKKRSWFKRPA